MKGAECWVTLADSDSHGWAAMVLARSIRKTLSTRSCTIAVSENVSQPLKVLLQREFDSVVRFETSEVGDSKFGLFWLWNLRNWTKCVYVDPNSYMLRNSDELFLLPTFSALQNQSTECIISKHLFVFQPNLNECEALLDLATSLKNTGNINIILDAHFKSTIANTKNEIPLSYLLLLDNNGSGSYGNFNIICFNELTPKNGTMKMSAEAHVDSQIVHQWVATFVHEVFPHVTKIKNEKTRDFLLKSIEKHQLPTVNGPAGEDIVENIDQWNGAIAVVGMSCRFPGANSNEEFWDLLISGKDPIRSYPVERPRPSLQKDLDERNFEAGFLKCPVDEFDAKFFGISPREAPFVDPQQRLLLEVIWESLENANINPLGLQETNTGVFVGIWQQEYDRYIPDFGLTANEYHHRYLGNAFSATASRISHFLGLYGPNYSIESGCSSSTSGVHLAVQSLRRGETSLAIVSGVNVVMHFINPLGGDDAGAIVLSNDFRCKTFDERADGYVRAEGCGAVVLKPMLSAIRDGDNIIGVIRGTALNNDGPATSFGTPNAKAQERVFREALADAWVRPCEVSFVEAHGTGTVVGDPIEMYAIGQVYSEDRSVPLLVSSVKSNIGHTESCAGMAGLIKVLLCMQHKKVPPHLHLQKLNPRIMLESIPAIIPQEVTDWFASPRIAAVSSFSMSGTNVHLIVQEPPKFKPKTAVEIANSTQLICISAKSEEALEGLCQKHTSFLEATGTVNLANYAYTLNTGRAHLSHRIALVAKDTAQVLAKLAKKNYMVGKAAAQNPKIIFLFTGQGSQYFGMAKGIYDASSTFRIAFSKCDLLFRKYLKCSLKKVLWGEPALLEQTVYCQPAIFSIQYCLFQLWHSFGIKPDFVLGHSVGEFCAAVCAGALSLDDAMKLVVSRSQIVHSLDAGSMLVVKTSASKTRSLIKEFVQNNAEAWIDVAAENSAEETVVSGVGDNVTNFANFCTGRGYNTQVLSASHAFHSRQMDPILEKFGKMASAIVPRALTCGYISGTLARELKKEDFDTNYWIRHLRDTVQFHEAVKFVWEVATEGRILVEIGSQPILLSLAMENIAESSQGTFCPSLRKTEEDLSSIFNSLSKLYIAGIDISLKDWLPGAKSLILPNYPFQRKKYWYENENQEIPLSPILHPLIGRQLQAPVSDYLFTQMLCTKDLPYVGDHRVAERVILPAAAYLEMIMAAGCQVLQGGRVQVPFTVENLRVEAALELNKSCQVQTLVRSIGGEEGVQFEIGIHKQVSREELDKWKRHAIGSFSPSLHNTAAVTFDLEKIKERLATVDSIPKAYEGVAKAGIQFGPKFQSIAHAWKGETEILTQLNLSESSASYICHPIILDGMIQTYAFRSALIGPEIKEMQLQLPISIKRFTWLSKETSSTLYVYTRWSDSSDAAGTVTLINDAGEALAVMEGLELLPTTVANFLRIMNSDANSLPGFLEEVWRPTTGITRHRVDTSAFHIASARYTTATLLEVKRNTRLVEGANIINRVFALYLLRGVLECHWPWGAVGGVLRISDWSQCAPEGMLIAKTEKLMEVLGKYGYLERVETGVFKVLKDAPGLEELESEINTEMRNHALLTDDENALHLYAKRFGQYFSSMMQGKVSPIFVHFDTEPHEVGALRFYVEASGPREGSEIATSVLLDAVSTAADSPGVLRILEVGAGSGVCCSFIVDGLAQLNMPFHYTFTDISPVFFIDAKKKFTHGVTFATFNIEEDPLKQGFSAQQFDVIIGTNVLHATANISTVLRNLNLVLRHNGILVIGELFTEPTVILLSFGFLDGWWRFQDRENSPILNVDQWMAALDQAGFDEVQGFCSTGEYGGAVAGRKKRTKLNFSDSPPRWLSLSDGSALEKVMCEKMSSAGRSVQALENLDKIPSNLEGVLLFWTVPSEDQSKFKEFLTFCQKFTSLYLEAKVRPRVVLVTRGVNYLGDAGPGNPQAATSASFFKTFSNEHADFSVIQIDLDQDEVDQSREAEELFASLWGADKELFRAVRGDKVFVPRIVSADKPRLPLPFPNSNRFKVSNPASKSLNDLEISVAPKAEPIGAQVEVAVRATALNFRDIFMILQPEGFEIPENVNKEPGLDIAGIVSAVGPECTKFAVGDAVFGFADGSGLASHVIVDSRFLIRKPSEITFTSAATIPVAFLTVLYSFQNCARLGAGDRVLIHIATGGVGLAAIQMAQHLGAEIFATAGSRRKRTYLRQIGVRHVYHSRSTAFGDEILADTHGVGVNVVLNSLTGPNFKEASLGACAHGARFVEIGKVNIWTVAEVKDMRPDVEYFVVDFSANAREDDPSELSDLAATVERAFANGVYRGLPHQTFPMDLIKEAFLYFQEARHIGKIVVSIPETSVALDGKITFEQNLFQGDSTYLITGGLGGIGLEMAKWMCSRGAKYLVLVGRRGADAKGAEFLEKLNQDGCHVVAIQADVGNYKECEAMLRSIENMAFPVLRGIMHAAGVLSDAIIVNQTWENIETVFRPKVDGTWNLHNLTSSYQLDFFVMFSSMVGVLGLPGQCNHSAANRFLDSFAHYRWSLGLPATTIDFGPWSDVGIAANVKMGEGSLGVRWFSPEQGILAIEKILREHRLHSMVVDVSDWAIVRQVVRLGRYLDEMKSDVALKSSVEEFKALVAEIKGARPEERQQKLEEFLQKALKDTLRIPENEQLDIDQNFSEIGVDSLMAMEMRNHMRGILGDKQLTVAAMQENRTIRSLAAHIASLTNADEAAQVDVASLVAQDSILPPEIQATTTPPPDPSHVSQLLLTGATGHLGVNFIPALQAQNPNLVIHCIVRGKNLEDANERLQKTLRQYSLTDQVNVAQIKVVVGDISKENLALPLETYEALAGDVDGIVHCAVKSNHLEEYNSLGESSLRTMNALSTVNLLRFAATGKTKRVLYASSLVAVTRATEHGVLVEDFPLADDFAPAITNGYILSKFVSEKLMLQASERGIPVTVIRYASLFGNSETGYMPTDKNHSWNILLSCIRVRKFIRMHNEGIPLMAVDTAAKISSQIFLGDACETGVYNLTSSSVATEDDIKGSFAKFGVHGEFVPFDEWRDAVFEESNLDKNVLAPFVAEYQEKEGTRDPKYYHIHPLGASLGTLQINTLSEKVLRNVPWVKSEIIPVSVMLERHLQYHYNQLTNQK